MTDNVLNENLSNNIWNIKTCSNNIFSSDNFHLQKLIEK